MVAIGFLLFAGALGVAAALVTQNRGENPVRVHAFSHTFALQPHSILAVGAAIALIALIGVAVMLRGAARARQIRRERDQRLAENARLADRGAVPESSFFFDTFADQSDGPESLPSRPAPPRPSQTHPSPSR